MLIEFEGHSINSKNINFIDITEFGKKVTNYAGSYYIRTGWQLAIHYNSGNVKVVVTNHDGTFEGKEYLQIYKKVLQEMIELANDGISYEEIYGDYKEAIKEEFRLIRQEALY